MNRRIFFNGVLFLLFFTCLNLSALCLAQEPDMKEKAAVQEKLENVNPFGVLEFLNWNHSWNNYKYPDMVALKKTVSLMKEAGVGWVRMDFLWQDIEPKKGDFDFKNYDMIVDLLNSNNIRILGLLDYSADWASSCGKWNYPPADNSLFVNYAVKVIEHYKGRVKFWEIWNEPDFHVYWEPQDGLKKYCALLKEVYTAAKQVYPECIILNGGLANGISSINKLYENGSKDYFDILNIHIFAAPLNEGAIKKVLAYPKVAYKIMKRNGDGNKKIWVTEIGCPGMPAFGSIGTITKAIDAKDWLMPDNPKEDKRFKEAIDKVIKTENERAGRKVITKNWWLGDNPDEQQQAKWVSDVFTNLINEEPVEKVFWAFFRDCNEHWRNGTDYFGLVCWNFSPKPSFLMYKKCFEDWAKSQKKAKE